MKISQESPTNLYDFALQNIIVLTLELFLISELLMIFISKYLVPKGYTGITIFPFVFLKSALLRNDKILVNHENIHLRQQLEMLIIPFFLWYGIEFMIRLLQYHDLKRAYVNISFEREAYRNDQNLKYLESRKLWAFLNYIVKSDV